MNEKVRANLFLKKAFALAQGGKDVINFGIGETDFSTPKNIVEAAHKAFEDDFTHYTPNSGIPELQEALVDMVNNQYNTNYKKEHALITVGGTEALYSIFRGLLPKDSEVLVPDPGFFLYNSQIELVGAKAVGYCLPMEKNFHPDINDIKSKITENTKMIVINSPGNPTGTIIPQSIMDAIAELAEEHDLIIVTDEVYDNIIYDGFVHTSVLNTGKAKERTILVNSLSKTYAMTGWRIGYTLLPEKYYGDVFKIHLNVVACASSFIQKAALEAITGTDKYLKEMLQIMQERKELIINELGKIENLSFSNPEGAFYVLIDISNTGMRSLDAAEILLEKYGLVTMPGGFFGKNGDKYLRFAFAIDGKKLIEGLKRFSNFYKDYVK